ncbi:MAG: type III secretion system inner membrane ring lipoprotein SctJ [Candidatus Thiodiazotropha sp. DIVDIV]
MIRNIVSCLALIIFLTACSEESLYSGLTEREANEMISLLSSSGIYSKKIKNNDERYSVSTSYENFSGAIKILKTNGYPKNRFESLGDVFKKEGFVSSPLEERARLNYAQSQELSRTIESIDGVILARVHLAIPKDNQLESKEKPSSASVFIKHKRGIDLTDRESQIKALFVNSIEGLPYENVTVAMFSSNPIPTVQIRKEDNRKTLFQLNTKYIDYIILILGILVLTLTIFTILLVIKNKKQSSHLRITSTES